MRALRPCGNAARLDHMAEKSKIAQVKAHQPPSVLAKECYAKLLLSAKSRKIIFVQSERKPPPAGTGSSAATERSRLVGGFDKNERMNQRYQSGGAPALAASLQLQA